MLAFHDCISSAFWRIHCSPLPVACIHAHQEHALFVQMFEKLAHRLCPAESFTISRSLLMLLHHEVCLSHWKSLPVQENSILRTHGYDPEQRDTFLSELGMGEEDWKEWVKTEVMQTLERCACNPYSVCDVITA